MSEERGIYRQFVRCGKGGCRCEGGRLQGPYYYKFWRDEGGKQRKSYVRKRDVPADVRACGKRAKPREEKGGGLSMPNSVLKTIEMFDVRNEPPRRHELRMPPWRRPMKE
jgi:hypothetical protein